VTDRLTDRTDTVHFTKQFTDKTDTRSTE